MSVDTIANMLSTIKNAVMVKKDFVEFPYSKQKEAVLKVLESRGFVSKVKIFSFQDRPFKGLHVDLSYTDGIPAINGLRRVSKPGSRVYKNFSDIKKSRGGYGVFVISTSRGAMSGEEAKKKKLGGEVICEVW